MSKAASTLGSIASLSPKKPESSPADRNSLSAASVRTRSARPESLPLSRHSEALPQRRPSSTRAAPASTTPSQKLPPQKPSSRSQSSDDDAQNTWREVEPSKERLSNGDSDVDNSALVSPAVVAHSFSVRLPAGASCCRYGIMFVNSRDHETYIGDPGIVLRKCYISMDHVVSATHDAYVS